jgi:hypothetical protein
MAMLLPAVLGASSPESSSAAKGLEDYQNNIGREWGEKRTA